MAKKFEVSQSDEAFVTMMAYEALGKKATYVDEALGKKATYVDEAQGQTKKARLCAANSHLISRWLAGLKVGPISEHQSKQCSTFEPGFTS